MQEEVKKVDALEKVKSLAQVKFEAIKAEAVELETQAKAIVIKDETTLAMSNQLLSRVNALLKSTKEKGLQLRKPYNDASSLIIEIEKSVTAHLSAGLDYGKAKIKEWNDKVTAEANAAKEKLAAQKHLLDKVVAQLTAKSDACTTPDECDNLIKSIEEKFPTADKFGPYAAEALQTKGRFISVLNIKKKALENALKGAVGSTDGILQMQQEELAVKFANEEAAEELQEKQEELQQVIVENTVKSNVRRTAKAVVVDVNLLPKEWLMPDMDKINAYLKEIKGNVNFPHIYQGVKFYYEETPIIK